VVTHLRISTEFSVALLLSPSRCSLAFRDRQSTLQLRSRELQPMREDGTWPALREAVQELLRDWHDVFGNRPRSLRIGLQEDLAETRQVTLPPVSDDDARRLLERNASRYFLTAREPVTVSVAAAHPVAEAAQRARIACAVPTRVLRAVLEAVRSDGSRVYWIGPSWSVLGLWLYGRTTQPARLLDLGETATLVTWHDGQPHSLRRFARGPEALEPLLEALRSGEGVVTVLGDTADEANLVQTLALHDMPVHSSGPTPADVTRDARLLRFLLGADVVAAPPLALPQSVAPSVRGSRRGPRIAKAALFTLALVLLAGWLYRRHLDSTLAQLQAERQALHAETPRRSAPDTFTTRAQWLESLQASPHWSTVLATLGAHLSPPTHLLRVRAQADTLELEGRTTDLAGAFAALDTAPGLRDLRAIGPVRRDAADAATDEVRFRFEGRWTP
jgi:hypothetical protein